MKRVTLVLVVVLALACASNKTPQPIGGNYALAVFDQTHQRNWRPLTDDRLPFYVEAFRQDLVGRGANVLLVSAPDQPAGSDALIVLSSDYGGMMMTDRGDRDASGEAVSREHLGKLSYRVLRGGAEVARGSVNVQLPLPAAMNLPTDSSLVSAVHALAADLAKKLAGS